MSYTARVFYRGSAGYARELVTTQARADQLLAAGGWRQGEVVVARDAGEGEIRVQDGHAYVDTV